MSVFLSEFEKVLPGAVLGLIPVSLTALFDWQEKRDAAQKQQRAIDIAHKRVVFLNDWIKAQESCMPDQLSQIKQEVSSELNQLKQDLAGALSIQEQRKAAKTAMRGTKKNFIQVLFLAYIPRGAAAWTLHTLYYLLLSMLLLSILFGGTTGPENATWTVQQYMADLGLFLLVLAPPMALIHWLARMSARRYQRVA